MVYFRLPLRTAALLAFAAPSLGATTMVTTVIASAGQSLPHPTARQIEFTVAIAPGLPPFRLAADCSNLVLRCSWRNVDSAPVAFLLKDHDDYHGTLSYPVGLQVRLTGPDGRVLTANSCFADGWWDFSCLCSQLSPLMPGDIIVLQPRETVSRKFALSDVLLGLDSTQAAAHAPILHNGSRDLTKTPVVPFTLPPGDSKLEVRLWGLSSAPIVLHLGET